MKKGFLLFSTVLASLCANAQKMTVTTEPAALQPGKEGFIVLTISDCDEYFAEDITFNQEELLQFSIPVPAGVTKNGDLKDVDFGGLVDPATADPLSSLDDQLKSGQNYVEVGFIGTINDVRDAVSIKLPVKVAADAALGTTEYNLEDLAYGSWIIGDNFDFTETVMSITISNDAPTTYAAKIYEAAGVTVNMNVADAASLQSYLSSHINAIAVFASAVPDEIAALDNVVVDGVAKSIVLTSQNEYPYTGEAFVAEKVSFEYWIATKATKAGGWNSLAIPFTGTPKDAPFTSADKTGGKYWAKVFTGSNSEGLLFVDLDAPQFEANKSYLVAFPGSDYGDNEYTSVKLNITAEDETVYPADYVKTAAAPYSMTTVYAGYTPASSYVLNAAGTKFEYKDAMQVAAPFTAFASAESGAPVLRSLAILDANQGITSAADAAVASTTVYGEDGEIVIIASEAGVASIVNMNGQVVKANVAYNEGETRVAIAAGAYVVAGQVVIVK